mgnify:CR=1 FL=1
MNEQTKQEILDELQRRAKALLEESEKYREVVQNPSRMRFELRHLQPGREASILAIQFMAHIGRSAPELTEALVESLVYSNKGPAHYVKEEMK